MALTETTNTTTGARRYYIDGRRVSPNTYRLAQFGRRVDTFTTERCGHLQRNRCQVRI